MSYSPGMTTNNETPQSINARTLTGDSPEDTFGVSLDVGVSSLDPDISYLDALFDGHALEVHGEAFIGQAAMANAHAVRGFVWFCNECLCWAVVNSEQEAIYMQEAHLATLILDDFDNRTDEDVDANGLLKPGCVMVIVDVENRLVRRSNT
jgi:hypothetical protein